MTFAAMTVHLVSLVVLLNLLDRLKNGITSIDTHLDQTKISLTEIYNIVAEQKQS